MSDLINRQDAIDAVFELSDKLANEMLFIDAIVDEIENIPSAEPERKWIPCSERLPEEKKQHYWVCTDTGYQCQCRWTNDVYGFGASDRWNWKIFDIPQYQKIVAWMLLPEPYGG